MKFSSLKKFPRVYGLQTSSLKHNKDKHDSAHLLRMYSDISERISQIFQIMSADNIIPTYFRAQ